MLHGDRGPRGWPRRRVGSPVSAERSCAYSGEAHRYPPSTCTGTGSANAATACSSCRRESASGPSLTVAATFSRLAEEWYKRRYNPGVVPTVLEHRAPVVGLICYGDHFRAIRVACPFCHGVHMHRWRGGDDLGPYVPWCGTPGTYRAVLAL